MENASKALIMAAEVLIGVMLISVGVYAFNIFADYSKDTNDKITDAQIAEFNGQFTKFYGKSTYIENGNEVQGPIKCTIHDITSLANLAQKNNIEYEVTNDKAPSANSYYIQIRFNNKNLEKLSSEDLIKLIKENSLKENGTEIKYYKCTKYEISEKTKRVNYVEFDEY